MRIAQISDFHFTHISWNPLRLCSKRMLGNLNWLLARRSVFEPKQLDPLPTLFKELNIDLVLLGGDFTTTALTEEFLLARSLSKSSRKTGSPSQATTTTIPTEAGARSIFIVISQMSGNMISHPVDFFTLKDHGIEAHKIAPGWWVVALDTARATNPYSSRGSFFR